MKNWETIHLNIVRKYCLKVCQYYVASKPFAKTEKRFLISVLKLRISSQREFFYSPSYLTYCFILCSFQTESTSIMKIGS